MEWYGMVWNGMEWYGMVWNGVEWYGMVWNSMEVSRTFDNVAPGFLALGKLVLEELRHLVADLMGNAVLRQEAAQEPRLCRFVFSQRSQASNEVAHCTDQRSRSYERPERNYKNSRAYTLGIDESNNLWSIPLFTTPVVVWV